MEETTTALKPFIRRPLTDVDRVRIHLSIQKASRLIKPLQVDAAAKFLIETRKLIDKVQALRKERGYEALGHDDDFMTAWEKIEVAARSNEALTMLSLAMAENMKLTHEINAHLGAMGRPLMKVYQA